LGWQGKHTNLVSRELGSWFFIGTILTTAELAFDHAETDHCGTCKACLDICPTNAFVGPSKLDARRCISYLTIEYKGHIAEEFRKPMGNRIYGCDDCLAVCPWNKFAERGQDAKLQARDDLLAPQLHDLLKLDDAAFRKLFSGSPVKRTGRNSFIRNCLIAAGNSGDTSLCGAVEDLLDDNAPQVRAMAVWALSQLASREALNKLRATSIASETDEDVLKEWQAID
jgi:epoxyqueuosine reductase